MRATVEAYSRVIEKRGDDAQVHRLPPAASSPLGRRWLMGLGPAAPLLVPALFAVLLFGF